MSCFLFNRSVLDEDLSFPAFTFLGLSLRAQDVEKKHPKWEFKVLEFCATSISSYKGLNYSTPFLSQQETATLVCGELRKNNCAYTHQRKVKSCSRIAIF